MYNISLHLFFYAAVCCDFSVHKDYNTKEKTAPLFCNVCLHHIHIKIAIELDVRNTFANFYKSDK